MAKFLDEAGLNELVAQVKKMHNKLVDDNTETGSKQTAYKAMRDGDGQNISSTYVKNALKGVANGIATLGSDGKVPSSQLPSYVDDVLEYASKSNFPATGETGKIYIAKDTNITYRWSGSAYVEISASLALGETSSTAYAGDKGKANRTDIDAIKAQIGTDSGSGTILSRLKAIESKNSSQDTEIDTLQTDVNNIKENKADANYEISEQGNFGILYRLISSEYCLELYGSENASGSNGNASVRVYPYYVKISGNGEMDNSSIIVTDNSIKLTAGGHSGDDTFSKVLEVTAYSLTYDDNEVLDASMAIPTSTIQSLFN